MPLWRATGGRANDFMAPATLVAEAEGEELGGGGHGRDPCDKGRAFPALLAWIVYRVFVDPEEGLREGCSDAYLFHHAPSVAVVALLPTARSTFLADLRGRLAPAAPFCLPHLPLLFDSALTPG
jgi:hypothetical protein